MSGFPMPHLQQNIATLTKSLKADSESNTLIEQAQEYDEKLREARAALL
jgi:hypothetical protein